MVPSTSQRGKNKACQICGKDFTFTLSEHQCKRCKRAVCDKCAQHKAHTIENGAVSKKPHRSCNPCKEESDAMRQFIEQYKIAFGVDTFAREWLKEYGQLDTAQRDYAQAKEVQIKFERTEIGGFDKINYSLQEFYLHVKSDPNKIKSVIMAFIGKYPEIPFTAELVFLTRFLMCFSSEASCFALLVIIYKQIVPSYFTRSTDFKQEQAMVVTTCQKAFSLQEDDTPALQTFLENRIKRYVSTFSLNLFTFEMSFYLVNQLINKYEQFIKTIAAALMLNIGVIKRCHVNFDEGELHMLRTLRSSQVAITQVQLKNVQFAQTEFLNTDQQLIANLRMDISALKLQQALQENEIENYKFQVQQLQSPDDQRKELFMQKKNDEIAQLMQRIAELEKIRDISLTKEDNYKQEIAKHQEMLKSTKIEKAIEGDGEVKKLIQEQRETIERLSKQVEYLQIRQSEQDAVQRQEFKKLIQQAAFSDVSASSNPLIEAELNELKQRSSEESALLQTRITQLEQQNMKLIEEQRVVFTSILGSLQQLDYKVEIIEMSSNPVSKCNRDDNDDYRKVIDTKNCQNQLLKQLLKQSQLQNKQLSDKLREIQTLLSVTSFII